MTSFARNILGVTTKEIEKIEKEELNEQWRGY